ncbi:MAG: hypothetical protein K9M07_02585 [Simkaniaceae bacterium]|nr:hypothetical protein [Simkaniaceae bacterium]MCF7852109.1 hypothetical protein [Simkaniaceae bacterium]
MKKYLLVCISLLSAFSLFADEAVDQPAKEQKPFKKFVKKLKPKVKRVAKKGKEKAKEKLKEWSEFADNYQEDPTFLDEEQESEE